IPGARAAAQSSRCGKSPNEPWGVWATIRFTPFLSMKIWKGRRTLRLMGVGSLYDPRFRFPVRLGFHLNLGFASGLGRICGLGGLRFSLGLVDRPDHVKGT